MNEGGLAARRSTSVAPRRPLLLFLVVPALWLTATARGDTARDQVIGTWRGSSICINREAAPACTDERVIYRINPKIIPAHDVLSAAGWIPHTIMNGGLNSGTPACLPAIHLKT
jgi:hypothetical protein